jgi:rubredoxin
MADARQLTLIIPMVLHCPECGKQHLDEGVWETREHRTHQCQHCGHLWRPNAELPTCGVTVLP